MIQKILRELDEIKIEGIKKNHKINMLEEILSAIETWYKNSKHISNMPQEEKNIVDILFQRARNILNEKS